MNKLSYEDVKKDIESKEYILLSNEYKDAHTKLNIKCKNNHIFEMRYNNFQQGQRCPVCKKAPHNKFTFDYVKNYIESFGDNLLSGNYKNANEKLKIQCKNNHIYDTTFSNYKKKNCPYCTGKKYWYNDVKNYIENEGHKLLTENNESINYRRLKFQCPHGHVYYTSFWNFKQNQRCKKCESETLRTPYDKVKEYFELFGYQLLSEEYKNNKEKLKLKCPNNHICYISFSNFKNHNRRCNACRIERVTYSYDYIKNYIEEEKCQLISGNYKNSKEKLEIICPKGHKFKMSFNSFNAGHRCPSCKYENGSSKAENEIKNFVKEIFDGTVLENNRNFIINPRTGRPLELDMLLFELKKAIEFNGIYWHSKDKVKERDKIKKEECKKLGIDLLIVKESDWISDKEKCLNNIKEFIYES